MKKKITLGELIEKYKYADFATLIDDPSGPIDDMIAAAENLRIKDFVGWHESNRGDYLKRDIWFNQTVNFAVTRNKYCPSIFVFFYFDDEKDLCLSHSKKLCESMLSKYGSAETMGWCMDTSAIVRTYADVTEHELRKTCLDFGDYRCDWRTSKHRITLTHADQALGVTMRERTISIRVGREVTESRRA